MNLWLCSFPIVLLDFKAPVQNNVQSCRFILSFYLKYSLVGLLKSCVRLGPAGMVLGSMYTQLLYHASSLVKSVLVRKVWKGSLIHLNAIH